MKKYRKSIWLPVALLVYTTAMAVYFIPRNTEISDTEKYLTVGLSYMIIACYGLSFVRRKGGGKT